MFFDNSKALSKQFGQIVVVHELEFTKKVLYKVIYEISVTNIT